MWVGSGAAGTAYWLAATDIDAEGQWVWQDGTPMSYANWNRCKFICHCPCQPAGTDVSSSVSVHVNLLEQV